MEEWKHSSVILDLGNIWREVVSLTPLSLQPPGKDPRYPLYRRLGGPQSRSDGYGENILCSYRESKLDSSVVQLVAQLIYRLGYPGS
jgi:hypothetical protein